jgi:RNA polymerase-binding transcription factor DksA
MQKDGRRFCDRCGKPIPSMSKLAVKTDDGKDLCLACQIQDAQVNKGLRH